MPDVTIRRGKGGPGRTIPIGQATTEALLVYLDEREQHPLAHATDLWLGDRGKQFGREGLSRSLRRRAQCAGVQGFRPHRLRHTAAHRWLAGGGSELDLPQTDTAAGDQLEELAIAAAAAINPYQDPRREPIDGELRLHLTYLLV